MTVSPSQVMRDADTLAREPIGADDDPLRRIADRAGVPMDDLEVPLAASAFAAARALDLNVPEDIARNDYHGVVASLAAVFLFGFLTGAWWANENQEEGPRVRWPEDHPDG